MNRRFKNRAVIQVLLSLVFLSTNGLDAAICDPKGFAKLADGKLPEVAREIELQRNATITAMMTTSDGTLSEVFELPRVAHSLRQRFPQASDVQLREKKWDDLEDAAQDEILSLVSKGRDFFQSRAVPYFKMKSELLLKPGFPYTFQGKHYTSGKEYILDVRHFLQPKVEYAVPEVENAKYLELHFRGKKPSELRADVEVFFDSVSSTLARNRSRVTVFTDHLHIPGKIPTHFFESLNDEGFEPDVAPATMTLYHQMAELAVLLENAHNHISPIIVPAPNRLHPPIVDYLDSESVLQIHAYFSALSRGENPVIGVTLKKNTIGVRGRGTFTDDSLWGFEIRFMNFNVSAGKGLNKIADGIKHAMDNQDYGISPETMAQFVEENKKEVAGALSKLWFRKNAKELLEEHADSHLKQEVTEVLKVLGRENFEPAPKSQKEFYALYPILLLRWENHPLVKYNPSLRNSVLLAQKKYLNQVIKNENSYLNSLFNFMKESGLQGVIDSVIIR